MHVPLKSGVRNFYRFRKHRTTDKSTPRNYESSSGVSVEMLVERISRKDQKASWVELRPITVFILL